VYPRGPKKPPLCVPCAIAAGGVRSSARNQSNLSRREVKKRVREAKGLQQPQPYVEAPTLASAEDDFELTSTASFDQGWAVSWDEGRDPHPGYPEPVRVTWGNDPFATPDAGAPAVSPAPVNPPPVAAAPAPPVGAAAPPPPPPAPTPAPAAAAPEPAAPPRTELPRLQPMNLSQGHAPARPGGLPSVRPPLKPGPGGAAKPARQPLAAAPPAPKSAPPQQPPAPPNAGRLRRKANDGATESTEMLGFVDDLLGSERAPQRPSGA
jgi:hypothetical protein